MADQDKTPNPNEPGHERSAAEAGEPEPKRVAEQEAETTSPGPAPAGDGEPDVAPRDAPMDREDAAALPSGLGPEPREVDVPPVDKNADTWKHDLRWAASLLFLAILGLAGWNNQQWQTRPEGRENLRDIVGLILGEQQLVLLLQLVGVLLVVALVAAVVLAIRDPEHDEGGA